MINGPKQMENGEWCVDVEEGYIEDFEHGLVKYTGAGACGRREGKRYYFPKGMKAAEVTNFWNDWVRSTPQYKPPRTGSNPVDQEEYVSAHGSGPQGIRRWRFTCRPPDTHEPLLKIEGDDEYAFVLPNVQALAQQTIGDCIVKVMATSGPPRRSGIALDEGPLDNWAMGQVRPFWINDIT
jgi:hypothetical protein